MAKKFLRAYTVEWNNEESDSLHLEYSHDGEKWYALNGNNGVLFPTKGSKRMKNPVFVKKGDSYQLAATDAVDEGKGFTFETTDLIHYTNEAYGEKVEGSDTIEITEEQLKALQAVWGKPEPVVLESIEEVTVTASVGKTIDMPKTVQVTYSNGMKELEEVVWDLSGINEKEAGTYTVSGKILEHQYTNPIIYHRADPFIYKHTDGNYYFTASHTDAEHNLEGPYQYRNISIRKAATLEGLADGSGEYEEKIVYAREPLPGNNSPHIWAPEIHFIQGKWYIYFTTAVDENEQWSIRPHALECDGDPMTTEWVNKGPIQTTTSDSIAFTDFSLDHTVLQHNGELYLFWAEKHPIDSDIYAAKMTNPWTIDSSRICKVVSPTYNWERHGFPVCEGPGFLHRNGKLFMTYSASGTDALYCIGMVTADENADLLDESSWTKSPYPIFQSSKETGQFGPGHNSFTYDEKGRDIFVYHARQEERYLVDEGYQPLYDAGRNTTLMRLYWNPDGTPNLSTPIPSGKAYEKEYPVKATVVVK